MIKIPKGAVLQGLRAGHTLSDIVNDFYKIDEEQS